MFGDDLPPTFQYFNSDRVPGKRMPYVPPLVTRVDATYQLAPHEDVTLRTGLGGSYVSPRPLPQSERSDAVFTLDASIAARWRGLELALAAENVLDRAYNLAEYNFSSHFPDVTGAAFPTRVPTRQVSPGPPRTLMLTLTVFARELLPRPRVPKVQP